MKSPAVYAFWVVVTLMALAMFAPALIALSDALLPLVVAIGVVVIVARLVFFHTRRW